MDPLLKNIIILLSLILLAAALLFFVRPAVTDWRAMRGMDQAMQADFEKFYSEPIGIPADEIDVTMESDEEIAAQDTFFVVWNDQAEVISSHYPDLSDLYASSVELDDYEPVELFVMQPVMEAFDQLTETDTYRLEHLLSLSRQEGGQGVVSSIRGARQYQVLEIQNQAKSGNYPLSVNSIRNSLEDWKPARHQMLISIMVSYAHLDSIVERIENWPLENISAETKKELAEILATAQGNYLFLANEKTSEILLHDHLGLMRETVRTGQADSLPANLPELTIPEIISTNMQQDGAGITSRAVAAETFKITHSSTERPRQDLSDLDRRIDQLIRKLN